MVVVCPDGIHSYYMDPKLIKILNRIKQRVHKGDKDSVIICDGVEGSGKSVFSMQVCKYLDPSFDLPDISFDGDSFNKSIKEENVKHKAKLFDEAYKGLSSRASLSKVNKYIVSNMMQMRQLNLFCVIAIPTFFLLDRYVSLFRAQYLFHIYEAKNGDHKWIFFNRKNKKRLFLAGRKQMDYSYPKIRKMRGIFRGKYTVDEQQYRINKRKALEEADVVADVTKYKVQRDILLKYIVKKEKLSCRKAEELLIELGFTDNLSLGYHTINDSIRNLAKTLDYVRM